MFEITDRVNAMTEDQRKGAIGVLVYELKDEVDQLDRWIEQIQKGGWSTIQLGEMKNRAKLIRDKLTRMGFPV